MNIFEFTEEDLKLNKRGSISPRQKEWLGMTARGIRSCSWTSALVAVFFLFLGLGITLALYLQNERSCTTLFSNLINLIMLSATALIVLAILALSILLSRRQANRLQNTVLCLRKDTFRSGFIRGKQHHLVFVGKKRFTFGDDMSNIFGEGENYKVYYASLGHMSLCCRMSR